VRVEHRDLGHWLQRDLLQDDYGVNESTTCAWQVYDLLEPFAEQVLVANPITSSPMSFGKVKQIACSRVTPALAGGGRETGKPQRKTWGWGVEGCLWLGNLISRRYKTFTKSEKPGCYSPFRDFQTQFFLYPLTRPLFDGHF
jgi:hypothetical protein